MKTTLLVFLVSAIVALVVVGILMQRRTDRLKADAAGLHRFCQATEWAMAQDEPDLRSTDLARRDAAFARFFESDVLYHNAASLEYCLVPVPPLPSDCWVNRKYGCLADFAHQLDTKLIQRLAGE